MDGEITKTPYNSIYETLKNRQTESEVACCLHGNKCDYAGRTRCAKSDDNQYVNLGSLKKEDRVASKLTEKLNKLAAVEDKFAEIKRKPELLSLNSIVDIEERKLKKGKNEKEKKKKKAPELVDDSQSYVMLGPVSDESSVHFDQSPYAPFSTDTSAITNTHFECSEASSAYIGVHTLAEAETRLTRRGEFALYHLFTPIRRLDALCEKLPLMLVYRTTTKKYRHYTIRTTSEKQFFVDCGYPNVRKHYSLNHLVMFYKISATSEINPDDTSADSFSWWLE